MTSSKLLLLLAPQSCALREGADRDFHTHTHATHALITFDHFSLYICTQKHLNAVPTNSKLEQSDFFFQKIPLGNYCRLSGKHWEASAMGGRCPMDGLNRRTPCGATHDYCH